jgi:hypothetical protein
VEKTEEKEQHDKKEQNAGEFFVLIESRRVDKASFAWRWDKPVNYCLYLLSSVV